MTNKCVYFSGDYFCYKIQEETGNVVKKKDLFALLRGVHILERIGKFNIPGKNAGNHVIMEIDGQGYKFPKFSEELITKLIEKRYKKQYRPAPDIYTFNWDADYTDSALRQLKYMRKSFRKFHGTTMHAEYMRSNRWREVRNKVFKMQGEKCAACNEEKNLNIHHLTYENWGKEPLTELIVLCKHCHEKIHLLYDDTECSPFIKHTILEIDRIRTMIHNIEYL